jgi:hypothetical protein
MAELLKELLGLLELVPTNVALTALIITIIFTVKRQDKVNSSIMDKFKVNDEMFSKGSSNFKLIDDNLLKIHEHFKRVHEDTDYLTKMVLKDIIYNESIDPHERQDAYDQYVKLGGNGQVKLYYQNVLEPLVREHTITRRGR